MLKLLAANWKENPKTKKEALALFKGIAKAKRSAKVQVVVCPPFIYLDEVEKAYKAVKNKKGLALGAQDVFWEEEGAFTGEMGPKMLKAMGASYVIIGHSERRKWIKETDEMINKKVTLSLAGGMNVILCVGESLTVRAKGAAAAKIFVEQQLIKYLKNIKKNPHLIIAYEPIWAIGTGRNATPKDARDMAQFIKKTLAKRNHMRASRVLYGGSVNGKNIADYVQYKEIDGALVGGASLKVEEFSILINIISQ
jgi:triosephosphate isomerase